MFEQISGEQLDVCVLSLNQTSEGLCLLVGSQRPTVFMIASEQSKLLCSFQIWRCLMSLDCCTWCFEKPF